MIETTPFTTVRNCFRCGKEFQSGGGKRICSACAKPKDLPKTYNPSLSVRETQVVNLVCKAKQNKEIAYALHLTEGTIKEYLNRIFRKIGVSNRTELAVWSLTNHTARGRHGMRRLIDNSQSEPRDHVLFHAKATTTARRLM